MFNISVHSRICEQRRSKHVLHCFIWIIYSFLFGPPTQIIWLLVPDLYLSNQQKPWFIHHHQWPPPRSPTPSYILNLSVQFPTYYDKCMPVILWCGPIKCFCPGARRGSHSTPARNAVFRVWKNWNHELNPKFHNLPTLLLLGLKYLLCLSGARLNIKVWDISF